MVLVARKHVYSVCGHCRYSDECPITPGGTKTPLLRRFQDKLLRSEIPTRPETVFMMGFCHACRAHYDFAGRSHFDLRTVILRYWAFKNLHGWARPVPANRVPLDILSGESSSHAETELEAAMNGCLEIEMMLDQVACVPKAPEEETLARLELVRSATLEWATRPVTPFRLGQSHILNKTEMTNEPEKQEKAPPPPQADRPTLLALCGIDRTFPRILDPESFDKITGGWYEATGQQTPKTTTTDQQQPEPVSRWSYSTVSSVASSVDSDCDDDEINVCLAEVEILRPVCYQPGTPAETELPILRPVVYQPAVKEPEEVLKPEGNWI
ncbi:hypothetical protein QBC37DRAFT_431563 [Rhypophila decipiens]|uniref:Uncharacterized protein n=1 Tax=Rhypophila decipiens TaxID=261697 RepID=A0AAN7B100_9PEZI|nr:hypothetical protein QBC37DRAFT_431563 [Rhypophila decipiens]